MVIKYDRSDSRCLYPENSPQEIHWATIRGNARTVVRELRGAVVAAVPEAAIPDAWGDVRALLERYEQCKATDPDDIKPVAQDQDLFELRLELRAYQLVIRVYETEVAELPTRIVALRAHRKVIFPGDNDRTARHQNANMRIASRRWMEGRDDFWGVR